MNKNRQQWIGFGIFIASLTLYLLTLEPTNSFWDCSEFIACAYGLQVGHAPGAPVFMLLGRLIGMLAPSPDKVAYFINMLSAISSALTVMLLFHCIVWFAKKMSKTTLPKAKILIAALIGSLSYAVSDSFWFSAVEAEVYATSSLFTALVFWAALKYAEADNSIKSYRWIILIFFILGLSVGIHLLNMLTIPAMALLVYFKHFKSSTKGILLTLSISIFLLLVFIFGIIPGVVKWIALADRIFVNELHLPVYSGAILLITLLFLSLYFAIQYFAKKKQPVKQVIAFAFTFWLIGYSSFAVLVIRSAKNPVIDINNVENLYGLVSYLNREQYPSRPLIYGNNYNSPIIEAKKRYTYKLIEGSYHKDELNPEYVYDEKTLGVFPRMASQEERHVQAYKKWVNIKGRPVLIKNHMGENQKIYVPTFRENLQFFWRYQLNHMYWRYFMWNFAGKQNDIQGQGSPLAGNWLSGIKIIDHFRLSDEKTWPKYYQHHAAKNKYFFLPLILGLVGIVFQFRIDRNNFWVNLCLFFFTGIAIVLYLNEVPITPRERDYVHVGSFYVFALWMGLGTYAIMDYFSKLKKGSLLVYGSSLLILLAVPGNMLWQNYNDHNRANRYTANAYAKNMLDSCEDNAILFTMADNDTYPLWYLQGVENYRSDVRNILTTFLPVDWYADQLHKEHHGMGQVPISFKGTDLLMKTNQYFPIVNRIDSSIDLKQVIKFVVNKDSKTKIDLQNGEKVNFIPGNKFKLTVNHENLVKSCSYINPKVNHIPETIQFTVSKPYLGRDDLLLLDIIAQNDWERPLYFVYPHLLDNIGLGQYLHREGILYRFLPFTQDQITLMNNVRAVKQYALFMNQFRWGNVEKSNVFLDHTNTLMTSSLRIRQVAVETAHLLIQANEKGKAKEVLDKAMLVLPPEKIPFDWFAPELVKAYHLAGYEMEANQLKQQIIHNQTEIYQFYESHGIQINQNNNMQLSAYVLQQLSTL